MLYLTEPIDEPALNNISDFKDFKFVDVTREDLDLGDVAEDEKKKVRNLSDSQALCHLLSSACVCCSCGMTIKTCATAGEEDSSRFLSSL